MPRCAGIKRDGGRCEVVVSGSSDYCYQHDPSLAEQRRRNASRAGRAKRNPATREAESTIAQLQQLADGVLAGSADRKNVAVATQALNAKLRGLEILRKWHEADVLLERIEALEERSEMAS
jgi:hypothetical protein